MIDSDLNNIHQSAHLNIADLNVEGLESSKETWINICVNGTQEEIELATKKYTIQIEEALNQPIDIILKKSQFTNLNDTIIIDRDPGKQAMERMRDNNATGKSLHEKAKSSIHGNSLAGYIPINQSFSKAGDDGRAERFNRIVLDRFASQKTDIKQLESILETKNSGQHLSPEQEEKLKVILAKNPISKKQLTDSKGRVIYGFRAGSEEPIFAYKNKKTGAFINEKTNQEIIISPGQNFQKIEIMSYITGITKGENGKFQLQTQSITGDHDQLAIGTKIKRGSTLQDINLSGESGFSDDIGHAATVALIDETKKSGSVRHGQDAGGAGTKNSLTDTEMQIITTNLKKSNNIDDFLSNDNIKIIVENKLGGNPYPENFSRGNYAVYRPNGNIMVAHNEQEIIDKYNLLEKENYNIGINPRYGWMRDKNDKLHLDPEKISAQTFLSEKSKIESQLNQHLNPNERNDAGIDADNLYKVNSLISLIKLQKSSPEKDKSLKASMEILHLAEEEFTKKYKVVPPTILAIVDKEIRQAKLTALLKSTQSQSLPLSRLGRRYSIPEIKVKTSISTGVINTAEQESKKNDSTQIFQASPSLNPKYSAPSTNSKNHISTEELKQNFKVQPSALICTNLPAIEPKFLRSQLPCNSSLKPTRKL